ncbi:MULTISPECIES: hypothetical protein [unclassified Alcanivorax]|jgi:hypothetical protein|uniref:hypothetical protein n=1 Tax=unclassified Alcanivorax TaxID=2638842 RepID=UPI00017EE8CE|nr:MULTISPECIES: hypothetical protein [unclassified Alcanivorax]EDX89614.1 hypothetical protein ADG881_1716 [Alcanivorax sp. DG881]
MDENTLHVAFPAPAPLRDAIDAYLLECEREPEASHVVELEVLVTAFVDVVLTVYFKGPIESANAQGAAARLILGAMRVINRAADSLVGRLIRNTTVAEQQALAGYFQRLRKTLNGRVYAAYPLEPAVAEKASMVFLEYRHGEGQIEALLSVMQSINDGAVVHFMDNSVSCLRLGRVNRALVSAARVTICKAAASATHKGLTAMDTDARKAVVNYFDNMLIRFDDG